MKLRVQVQALLSLATLLIPFNLAAGAPTASVLTFEDLDIPPDEIILEDGYHGFDWGLYGAIDMTTAPSFLDTGYGHGVVSGTKVAFSPGILFANSIGRTDSNYTFVGAYFTAAWRNGLGVTLTGLLDGTTKFAQTFVLDSTAPTWKEVNFTNIDELRISAQGGTNAGYLDGTDGDNVAFDDFTYLLVPEPNACIAGWMAACALTAARSRRRLAT